MKRSSRVSFVSQCTTSLSECAVTGSIFGGAFISCSRAVTWLDGTGYAVCPAREDAAVAPRPPFQSITRLWQFEGLSVKHGPSDRFAPKAATWLNVSFGHPPIELPHTRCKYHVHPYGVIAR